MIAVLAGGTGGAKLARGLVDVAGPDDVVVIANTGDDFDVYGVHVSPDPDLITYWLADVIDEQGWGIADDSWQVMDALESLGQATWFRLGDRDLACCLIRTEHLRDGARQTEAQAAVAAALGVPTRVLPMADEPVRTRVETPAGERSFQQFMVLDRAELEIKGVRLDGAEAAQPTAEVLAAVAAAEAIVIGPSNPIVSIGPILALPALRQAIARAAAPVVAVSPWVGGRIVKGPTDSFCAWAGLPSGAAAVDEAYRGLLDGLVTDERYEPGGAEAPAVLVTDTLMDSAPSRRRLASETLEFAKQLV